MRGRARELRRPSARQGPKRSAQRTGTHTHTPVFALAGEAHRAAVEKAETVDGRIVTLLELFADALAELDRRTAEPGPSSEAHGNRTAAGRRDSRWRKSAA